ncbi:MAG TPA: hypothetical protein VFC31_12710 [Candidatus Limnocylindria bacterium]|nr:hypothetical protein [Candidatus Limnocylindria bacterium]
MRFTTPALALALAWVVASPEPARAAERYSASYVGESAFVTVVPGATARFTAIFLNDGAEPWEPNVVGLLACGTDGVDCGAPHATAEFARDWYSTGVYATVAHAVAPGQLAFFSYDIAVPGGTAPGTTVRFDGAVGLIPDALVFGGDGYYQEATIPEPGIAERLTISGSDSPKVVGERLTIAVDIDDVNVELVGGDDTTAVTAALDPATCAGAGGGNAYLESATSVAVDGRAWFHVQSAGAYPACRFSVSAPGLLGSTRTIVFAPSAPAQLSCSFAPALVANDPSAIAVAAVELRDAYGNAVPGIAPYTVRLAKASGEATTPLGATDREMRLGAAFFFVRPVGAGVDVYDVVLTSGSLPAPTARCAVSAGER